MSKIVVYTAIIGDKDTLLPVKKRKDCDFVCFTDNTELKAKNWDIKLIEPFHNVPRLSAKPFKILPHYYFPEYEYSIWMDGTFIPEDSLDISKFVYEMLGDFNIAVYKHVNTFVIPKTSIFYRDCIYDEAEVCLLHNLDSQLKIINQVKAYREFGYPVNNGLSACSIMVRQHNNTSLQNAMNDWWKEVTLRSIRDQISFRFVLYKHDIKFGEIDGNIYRDNPYFVYSPHKKEDPHNTNPEYHKWIQIIRQEIRKYEKDVITICSEWISTYNMDIPLETWFYSGILPEEAAELLIHKEINK